jgi:predicted nucleotidyltransferase
MAALDTTVALRARRALSEVSSEAVVQAAYVFGSQVDGTADEWSDIDIAAFIDGLESWDIMRRARASARAQKAVGDDIEFHLFPSTALENPEPASFAAYILRVGVRLDVPR